MHLAKTTTPLTSSPLTARQALFVAAYLENPDVGQAYLSAGYKSKDKRTGASLGSMLIQKPHIAQAIERHRLALQTKTQVNLVTLTDQLKAAYDLAIELDDPKAMISSTMSMAKLHGLDVKKVDVKHTHSVDIQGATDQLFSLLSGRGAIEGGVGEKVGQIGMVASPPNTSASFQSSLQPVDAEVIEDDDT